MLQTADTIYLGGGTPSLLTAEQIKSIIGYFGYTSGSEISLEINPLQITEAYLKELSTTPLNRLSLGLQSMIDTELDWLSRKHHTAQIAHKIQLLHDYGYENFSLDLIYGLPGATLEALRYNLDQYLALAPRHISTYLLERERLEREFPQSLQLQTEIASSEDEDELQAQSYELIRKMLIASGYTHYEISNFALPGAESTHNLHYWHGDDYLGLGASASGFLNGLRYSNPADLEAYYHNIESGLIIPDPETGNTGANDYLMMGLRLCEGIDLKRYRSIFGRDIAHEKSEAIHILKDLGLVQIENGFLSLTAQALFISNAVIGELLD